MNGLAKIIEYIRMESDAECKEVTKKAVAECERIRAEFSKKEQDEYWVSINAGTKETEQRLEQLKTLAAMEAQKKLLSTQQEMLDKAFSLAAEKLQELPAKEYKELLKRLEMSADSSAEDIVLRYKHVLKPSVISALFD